MGGETEQVVDRVRRKAATYGQDSEEMVNYHSSSEEAHRQYKVSPDTIAMLYDKWVMPMTKQVQVHNVTVHGLQYSCGVPRQSCNVLLRLKLCADNFCFRRREQFILGSKTSFTKRVRTVMQVQYLLRRLDS